MFLLKHYVRRHGLRTPNDAFFFKIPNFCAWADKFWAFGVFSNNLSAPILVQTSVSKKPGQTTVVIQYYS